LIVSAILGAGEKRNPATTMAARNMIMPRPVSAPMRSKLLPSGFSWGNIWLIAALRFVDASSQN
jgi:hypothetical protein